MTGLEGYYPVRIVSRAVTRKRVNTLRLLWFFIGIASGVGGVLAMLPQDSSSTSAMMAEPVIPDIKFVAPNLAAGESSAPAPQEVALTSGDGRAVETVEAQDPPTPDDPAAYPLTLSLKVERGDTLISLLTDAGVAGDEAHKVVQTLGKDFNPKRLSIGQNMTVTLDKPSGAPHSVVMRLALPTSPTSSLEVTRSDDNTLKMQSVDVPVERKLARAGGRIASSLYETGADAGIPAALLSEIINAYSYDIDFQRDIQSGDAIDVLYERMETGDGTVAGHGNVVFAELASGGQSLKIYRYTDKNGDADYYNEKGESVRKALLRTPVNGARITSRFGKRLHPILGYSKMHRGVDFGAPAGTPIYAAGDGTVELAGRKGGYGNYLRLRHNGQYATAYGHISRFAAGIKSGKRVRQGQVVAYVGSTGMSTGPHLHYEVLMGNVQVNPAGVKFKTGTVLKGTELANFRKAMEKIEAMLNTLPKGGVVKLAMADEATVR